VRQSLLPATTSRLHGWVPKGAKGLDEGRRSVAALRDLQQPISVERKADFPPARCASISKRAATDVFLPSEMAEALLRERRQSQFDGLHLPLGQRDENSA